MPKRLRYPIFLLGLVVVILGSLVLQSERAQTTEFGIVATIGFIIIVLSVALR